MKLKWFALVWFVGRRITLAPTRPGRMASQQNSRAKAMVWFYFLLCAGAGACLN